MPHINDPHNAPVEVNVLETPHEEELQQQTCNEPFRSRVYSETFDKTKLFGIKDVNNYGLERSEITDENTNCTNTSFLRKKKSQSVKRERPLSIMGNLLKFQTPFETESEITHLRKEQKEDENKTGTTKAATPRLSTRALSTISSYPQAFMDEVSMFASSFPAKSLFL